MTVMRWNARGGGDGTGMMSRWRRGGFQGRNKRISPIGIKSTPTFNSHVSRIDNLIRKQQPKEYQHSGEIDRKQTSRKYWNVVSRL